MSETRWPKFRLKKDTPDHRAGEIFWKTDNWMGCDDEDLEEGRAFKLDNIDNFDDWFEEVKESGWWKPSRGDSYYFVQSAGVITYTVWMDNFQDRARYSLGNYFSTEKAAERYRDYLEAIATARRDEGVLTTKEACEQCDNGNRVYCLILPGTVRNTISAVAPGGIYFKDTESAGASWDAHHKEWQTIINYDWSRE